MPRLVRASSGREPEYLATARPATVPAEAAGQQRVTSTALLTPITNEHLASSVSVFTIPVVAIALLTPYVPILYK
jgi:hypothetical protein